MKTNEAPEKLYILHHEDYSDRRIFNAFTEKESNDDIEYVRKNAFIKKACEWIKENITNNQNANSVLVRNGCVTLGMLVDDFKNYMEE